MGHILPSVRDALSLIAAPMVNQSDLPFRLLTRRHGATMTYTQMLSPDKILGELEYLEFHQRDLELARRDQLGSPVVVQLYGNDPDKIVRAGRKLEGSCDAIGMCCLSFRRVVDMT